MRSATQPPWRPQWPLLLPLLLLCTFTAPAAAGISSRFCDPDGRLSLEHKDRLLRVTALVRAELERSGAEVAIVSRAGLDLARWGIRYSHAGVSLRHGTETPWAVRQLYYACDEQAPRIFDQGLAAFLFGADQPERGFISIVLLPGGGEPVRSAALDNRLALALLAGQYSANAYAFSTRYQNCNQWLAEMLAAAWGGIGAQTDAREAAQRWLRAQGYEPTPVEVGWRPLVRAGPTFVPWVHNDDHPEEDLAAARYRISLPAAVEGLVRAQVPAARRIEFCYSTRQLLVRRGWGPPLAAGCIAEPGDEVSPLD